MPAWCAYFPFVSVSSSMVAGTPAKVIGYMDEKDPSLTMNHGKSCVWASVYKPVCFSN
jgi:hypothetical protein